MTATFVITGKPVPWARARRGRHGSHSFTPPAQAAHADIVGWHAKATGCWFKGPVAVTCLFVFPRPQRMVGDPAHTGRPDADNLVKQILDACTGVLWRDDSQVVRLTVWKRYARVGEKARTEVAVADGVVSVEAA